jgi:hypothetical protein
VDRVGGLRAFLGRFGRPAEADDDQVQPEAPAIASNKENCLRALRANAHAAFKSVQGTETAAIDAAVDVVAAELETVCSERAAYAEALKAIRLYAEDPRVRALAAGALDQRKGPATWDGGLQVTGRDRFPFIGDFDD